MLVELILGLLAIFALLYYQLTKNRNYWSDRGVPSPEFKAFGSFQFIFSIITQKKSMQEAFIESYKEYDSSSFIGGFNFGMPILMIRNDFDLIKAVFVKDFDHFAISSNEIASRKSIWPATRHEKLILNNVQTSQGDEWKTIR